MNTTSAQRTRSEPRCVAMTKDASASRKEPTTLSESVLSSVVSTTLLSEKSVSSEMAEVRGMLLVAMARLTIEGASYVEAGSVSFAAVWSERPLTDGAFDGVAVARWTSCPSALMPNSAFAVRSTRPSSAVSA